MKHYVDEARHIQMDNQPFWYGGMLHVYNLGPYSQRADINDPGKLEEAKKRFDAAVAELKQKGGGVMQTYYHPTEFVATEFWDGVNFRHGQYTAPGDYQMPKKRTKEASEQAYRIFLEYVKHVKANADVEVVTAADLAQVFPETRTLPGREEVRKAWADGIAFSGQYSAAEMLLSLLGVKPRVVDGPTTKGETTWSGGNVPRGVWTKAVGEARAFVESEGRLPAEVWLGSERLALEDFAATLAEAPGSGEVPVQKGRLRFTERIATDGKKNFNWVIHPEGFDGTALLDLGRLEAWTLKPAVLKRR